MNKIKEKPTLTNSTVINHMYSARKHLMLGLLLTTASISYAYEEDQVAQEIIQELDEQSLEEQLNQEIDQELFEIFHKFFDEKDATPFTKMINRVVVLLKRKKITLPEEQRLKCDEIIKSLEKNKHNFTFHIWARILIAPDLMNLMSPETKRYIDTIPAGKKIQALMYKLKNHNSHSFF